MAETVGVAPQELSEQEMAEVRELAKAIKSIFGLKPKYIDAGFGEYQEGKRSWFTASVVPSVYEGDLDSLEVADSCVRVDRHPVSGAYPAGESIMLRDCVTRSSARVFDGGETWTMFITVPDDQREKPRITLMGHLKAEMVGGTQAQIGFIKKFVNAL